MMYVYGHELLRSNPMKVKLMHTKVVRMIQNKLRKDNEH